MPMRNGELVTTLVFSPPIETSSSSSMCAACTPITWPYWLKMGLPLLPPRVTASCWMSVALSDVVALLVEPHHAADVAVEEGRRGAHRIHHAAGKTEHVDVVAGPDGAQLGVARERDGLRHRRP